MRRFVLALSVSLAVHLLVVAIAVGVGLWQTVSLVPDVKMQPIAVEVKDLPLGPPPTKSPEAAGEPRARSPRARHRIRSAHEGVVVPGAPDAGAEPSKSDALAAPRPDDGGGSSDGGRREPGDLRANGPEGSRLIALLRIDRLRASADSANTIAALDRLLVLLPDRRRLIERSGLDLYRDFDTLLVATPNPADASVTFLAVRHHLTDAALQAGLNRGAKAAHQPIEWLTLGGRPVGLRRQPASAGFLNRDDRILVLPQTSLAIMATPAYASLLLGVEFTGATNGGSTIDAGSPAARAQKGPLRKTVSPARWQRIAQRIEAEERTIPDDAAFMMMATGLFAPIAGPAGYLVPPTRGASDDQPPQPVGDDSTPPPQTLNLLVGVAAPYLEVSAEFASAAEADRWEHELPIWRRRLMTNPMVILSGFASLIGRAETSREGTTLRLHVDTSIEELQRLLNLAANLTRSAIAAPR